MQLDANQRDALMGRLSGVMRNLDEATRAIADQLNVERTDVLLAKVHTALDEFNRGLDQVNLILTESRQPLNATLTHVAHAAETIDMRIVEQFARETDLTDGASLLSKVHTGIDHLTKTLSDLSRVSDTARQIMVLNRDNINETLRNLKETSDHINYGIKFLIRRPWLLFNKPTAVETKQADILDAARSFLDAAGRLDDAASELRALADLHDGHIPDDDADLERIREALGQSFEAFKSAETALWEELDVK
jgi:ABC-type transporter Mla subunit MlaD